MSGSRFLYPNCKGGGCLTPQGGAIKGRFYKLSDNKIYLMAPTSIICNDSCLTSRPSDTKPSESMLILIDPWPANKCTVSDDPISSSKVPTSTKITLQGKGSSGQIELKDVTIKPGTNLNHRFITSTGEILKSSDKGFNEISFDKSTKSIKFTYSNAIFSVQDY